MSISRKLSVWTFVSLLLIGTISLAVHYYTMTSRELAIIEALGTTTAPLVETAIVNYMITRENEILNTTLRDIATIEPISRVLLINNAGIIRAGSDKRDMGQRIVMPDTPCSHRPKEEGLCGVLRSEKIFQFMQPVRNKPQCYSCHSPAVKINGAIVIDFSTAGMEQHVKKHIAEEFLVFFAGFTVSGFVLFFLSNTLVLKRLVTIRDTLKKFKDGNYEIRLKHTGYDEITELEQNFNAMAESLALRYKEKDAFLKTIHHSQVEWRNTVDSITDLIFIYDQDHTVIRSNRAFAEYFGFTPKEVINRKCSEIFSGTGIPLEEICRHRTNGDARLPITNDVRLPGTGRILRITTYPYHTVDTAGTKKIQAVISIARDVTDEREREMRLIMSERLAALGQMASGIAHEINNPLSAIAGCAEGLLNRVEKEKYDPGLFKNYLNIIVEEISRCKTITTDMLSFVRKTTYEKKEVNINDIITKTVEIIGLQGRLQKIEVKTSLHEALPPLQGSEGELRQALLAIITNALDAMENRGVLTIRTGVTGNTISVTITDTGHGISPEHLKKIYDPFFTTKAEKDGTGLGLSIARRIILNHNGTLDVASKEGEGSTFTMLLPV